MMKMLPICRAELPQCANCGSVCNNSIDKQYFSDLLPTENRNAVMVGTKDSKYTALRASQSNHIETVRKESNGRGRNKHDVASDSDDDKEHRFRLVTVNGENCNEADPAPLNENAISIYHSLLRVFDFNWKCLPTLRETSEKNKENLFVCSNCLWCLSKLYHWYDLFTTLTRSNPKSYLHQVVYPVNPDQVNSSFRDGTKHGQVDGGNLDSSDAGQLNVKSGIVNDYNQPASRNQTSTRIASSSKKESHKKFHKFNWKLPKTFLLHELPQDVLKHVVCCEVKLTRLNPEHVEDLRKEMKCEEEGQKEEYSDFYSNQYSEETMGNDSCIEPFEQEKVNVVRKPELSRGSRSRLRSGMRSKLIPCQECGQNFKNPIILSSHIRAKHRNIFECSYCRSIYSDSYQLRTHMNKTHGNEKKFMCEKCEKKFFTAHDMRKHRFVHIGKRLVTCQLCNGTFPSDISLKAHQLTHSSTIPNVPYFLCSEEGCHKRFMNYHLLQTHIKYQHTNRNDFSCPYEGCDKTFGTETYLNTHLVSHSVAGTHLCELCGKNYKHKKDLRIHEQRYHSAVSGQKPHACGICPSRYYRADHLRVHRVKQKHYLEGEEPELPKHSPIEAAAILGPFKCDICNKECNTDISLRSHELTHEHDNDHQFGCSECGRKYTTSKALEYHSKYMHRLKGSFSCTFCPKSFGRISSFRRHMQIHSSTQHICGECGKVYKNKSDLQHHCRREHLLKEDCFEHECLICGKRYYRKDSLRAHVAKHKVAGETEGLPLLITTKPNSVEIPTFKTSVETNDDNVGIIYVMDRLADLEGNNLDEDSILPETNNKDEIVNNDGCITAEEGQSILSSVKTVSNELPGSAECMIEEADGSMTEVTHLVMLDENGQPIGTTQVLCATVRADGNLDTNLNIFEYSIEI